MWLLFISWQERQIKAEADWRFGRWKSAVVCSPALGNEEVKCSAERISTTFQLYQFSVDVDEKEYFIVIGAQDVMEERENDQLIVRKHAKTQAKTETRLGY